MLLAPAFVFVPRERCYSFRGPLNQTSRVGTWTDSAIKLVNPPSCGRWRTPRGPSRRGRIDQRSEEHTSELQSLTNLVCRLLLAHATPAPARYPLSLHDALPIYALGAGLRLRATGTMLLLPGPAEPDQPRWDVDGLGYQIGQSALVWTLEDSSGTVATRAD